MAAGGEPLLSGRLPLPLAAGSALNPSSCHFPLATWPPFSCPANLPAACCHYIMKVAMTVRNGNWEWEWPWELGLGLGLDDGQPLLLMAVTLFFQRR